MMQRFGIKCSKVVNICYLVHFFHLFKPKDVNQIDVDTVFNLSLVVRKPAFCICENNDADQLLGNREADQRLCFRYTESTIPLLPTSEISSL